MCRHDGTVWQPVSKNYYANDIGTANTISLVLVPQPASWNDLIGKRIAVKIAASNTGATTIAIAGCAGTKAVKKQVSAALAANDLLAGGIYEFIFDGTNVQTTSIVNVPIISPAGPTRTFNNYYLPQNTNSRSMVVCVTFALQSVSDEDCAAAFLSINPVNNNAPGDLVVGTLNFSFNNGSSPTVLQLTAVVPQGWYYKITKAVGDTSTVAIQSVIEY
jgi:hypothetical protein